jgi:IS1 family transposase
VVAYHIGKGLEAAREIYRKVKECTRHISHIYSDANSCYSQAFMQMCISEPHTMTKAQTHLIESSNSSIRDNLARFTRKSKRFSKSFDMLDISLNLFFASFNEIFETTFL